MPGSVVWLFHLSVHCDWWHHKANITADYGVFSKTCLLYAVSILVVLYNCTDDVNIYEIENSQSGNDDDVLSWTDDIDTAEYESLDEQWQEGTSEGDCATSEEGEDEGNCLL